MYILRFFIGIINVWCIRSQVVRINTDPYSVTLNQNVTLTCSYSGTGNETGVRWFRVDDIEGVTYVESPSNPGACIRFIGGSAYNLTRFTTKCNAATNNYTLSFTVLSADIGTSWCCSYIIPGTGNIVCDLSVQLNEATTTSATTTTATATTITTTTTTKAILTTNTEMGTTKNIMATSSCPPPVLVIIGISVSGFLFILLIFIVCCCLYHCRKKQNTDTYEAEFVEAYDNEDANNHTKAKDRTPNPAYVLSNAPSESSTSDKFKEAVPDSGTLNAPIQSSTHTANQTSTSNQDWKNKPVPNKNEVKESKHGKGETTNM